MTPARPEPSASEHPATWRFDFPIHHVETRAQWRAWLEHNHTSARGVWLCSWRTGTGRPRCPYPEVVEESLCFGWIDSTAATLDADRTLQLITPRKAKSPWSRLNRRRAADMEDRGLMTDAGRAAIDAAKANGWWTIADPVEDLEEPADLAAALDASPVARANWDQLAPSARKLTLWSIVSAARPETRAKRIAAAVADAEAAAANG
ncbi:MAG: YdeI/OmpD-associated family protein [Actinomycetota bacterium]|nr:YdeI/OmpD-associated family protein [Actinomycetota bacterium]